MDIKDETSKSETKDFKLKNLKSLRNFYDFSGEQEETPTVNSDLTKEELAEVEFYAQLKCGVMVVTGEPGAGKDTFMFFLLGN